MDNRNMFQFVPTEDGELVLFIYAREGMQDRPVIRLVTQEHRIEFYRNEKDAFNLNEIDETIMAKLEHKKNILVCEVLPAENAGEVEISNSYLIDISI